MTPLACAAREAIGELNRADPTLDLQMRAGVTTGEAVIDLSARADHGEQLGAGDVVVTASRLQANAPVGGILADEATYRATQRVIEYGQELAVEAKGKAEPVRAWVAVAP